MYYSNHLRYDRYKGGCSMIITFCGHKELYDEKEVKVWLERVTENLIVNGAETFYLG